MHTTKQMFHLVKAESQIHQYLAIYDAVKLDYEGNAEFCKMFPLLRILSYWLP